jgi:site-specific DNA-methyltransferase (adenine-specific)
MQKKYKIIYADPPWSYNDRVYTAKGDGKFYSLEDYHYKTMSVKEICELPVNKMTDENCILFMWATFPNLKEALQVIEAWGFQYKTLGFSWIKTNQRQNLNQMAFFPTDTIDVFFGIGHYTKSNCEVCLIGTKGKPEIVSNYVSSVVIAPRGKHSKKPNEVRNKIVELCGDKPRIELFARQAHTGWDTWGNQVENSINLCFNAIEPTN